MNNAYSYDITGCPDADADAVRRARALAEDVLVPRAEQVDQSGVIPRSHFEAIAEAGFYGLFGPRAFGGMDAHVTTARAVSEALAGGCGATFFLWWNHHSLVRIVAESDNAELKASCLEDLCRGKRRGGNINYLRRAGPPALVAEPVTGGFRVSGRAPWATGWGLLDMFLVAAVVEGADKACYFCLPGHPVPGVVASPPVPVLAMGPAVNVRLDLDRVFVPERDVARVADLSAWRERDRGRVAQPTPALFGVMDRALMHLTVLAEKRGAPQIASTATALGAEFLQCRERAYSLPDPVPSDPPEEYERRHRLRAWSFELAQRITFALVAASGGGGMELTNPAQRLNREALFYCVQSQGPAVRDATLNRACQLGALLLDEPLPR